LMARIKAYKVKLYNPLADEAVVSRRLASREGAAIMKGVVLDDTEVEVDESQLEPGEKWTPRDLRHTP
jgi:hypothetical protein